MEPQVFEFTNNLPNLLHFITCLKLLLLSGDVLPFVDIVETFQFVYYLYKVRGKDYVIVIWPLYNTQLASEWHKFYHNNCTRWYWSKQ